VLAQSVDAMEFPDMSVGRILVIAPELDMRNSLQFVLEAEGYDVTPRPRIDFDGPRADGHYDVTVIDHRALSGPHSRAIEYCGYRSPVVLLSSRPIPWLMDHVAQHVEKPVVGDAVVAAVHAVLHDKPPHHH
jgi:DNA-binding response OmpR family regulator